MIVYSISDATQFADPDFLFVTIVGVNTAADGSDKYSLNWDNFL